MGHAQWVSHRGGKLDQILQRPACGGWRRLADNVGVVVEHLGDEVIMMSYIVDREIFMGIMHLQKICLH